MDEDFTMDEYFITKVLRSPDDYEVWRVGIEAVLKGRAWWHYVTGQNAKRAYVDVAFGETSTGLFKYQEAWEVKDNSARAVIVLNCADHTQTQLDTYETKEVWDFFHGQYKPSGLMLIAGTQ